MKSSDPHGSPALVEVKEVAILCLPDFPHQPNIHPLPINIPADLKKKKNDLRAARQLKAK